MPKKTRSGRDSGPRTAAGGGGTRSRETELRSGGRSKSEGCGERKAKTVYSFTGWGCSCVIRVKKKKAIHGSTRGCLWGILLFLRVPLQRAVLGGLRAESGAGARVLLPLVRRGAAHCLPLVSSGRSRELVRVFAAAAAARPASSHRPEPASSWGRFGFLHRSRR